MPQDIEKHQIHKKYYILMCAGRHFRHSETVVSFIRKNTCCKKIIVHSKLPYTHDCQFGLTPCPTVANRAGQPLYFILHI